MSDDRAHDAVSFGPFTLYRRERRLEREGQNIKIGSRALDILVALIERAGDIVEREELLARIWPDTAVEDSGLRVHVAGLRKAIGDGVGGARYVTNVPGRGYSFVAPVSYALPSGPANLPSTPPAANHNLPSRLERIIGRDEVIRELSAHVLAKRFVSVVGPGGMGKTTVVVAVAHALLGAFGGDVCFVDMGSVSDPRHVPNGIASALGLVLHSDDVAAGLAAFLRDRRVLIVLDSCEHVMAVAAPLAERLCADVAGAYLLVTSRESLRVEGEHVYRLPPLACPPESVLTASEALGFAAVQLFVERATAGGARLPLTDLDAPVVVDICRRLDGIALAIEFAAGRVDAYGVRGTASLLENRFKLVWRGRRTAPPRHRTLSALLDWSYYLLDEPERRLLRRLSIYVGFFSLDAVAAIAVDLDGEQAVDALASLVDKSLVSVDVGGTAGVRYRLLDTTRAYAQAKLEEANERSAVARLHAGYLCQALEQEQRIGDGAHARSLAEYVGNVRVALAWCFSDLGEPGLGTRLFAAAVPMFMELSLLRECYRWAETALAALDAADRGTRREMNLQAALGVAAMFTQGNGAEVRSALDRGVALAADVDEPHEQLRLFGALNILLTRTGEWRDALAVGQRSEVVAARLVDDPAARLLADWMIGTSCHLLGDQIEAERRCRTAIAPSPISRSTAMLYFGFDHRIRGLVVLGRSLWLLGRADDALRVASQTVREAAEIGQPTTVAISLVYTSSVFLWSGDFRAAGEVIERLIQFAEKHSLGPYYFVGLGLRGELSVRSGDPAGVDTVQRAMEKLHAGRHDLLHSVFATAIAEGFAAAGQVGDALLAIEQAIASTDRNGGAAFDLPEILRVKGKLHAVQPSPDHAQAERCLMQALDCARRQSALAWELRAATTVARLWSDQGRTIDARKLLTSTYERFTQGFGTADLRAAKQLLDAL